MKDYVVFATCLILVNGYSEQPGYNYMQGTPFSRAPTSIENVGFSNGGFGRSGSGPSPGVVQKHIYVHVPPPDFEESRPQRPVPVAPAQKHYKIIFIKAPIAATPTVPVIPAQAQNEERTLVYVLVKRPEEAAEITIPTPAPNPPSKPEVYFIRYKARQETTGSGRSTIGRGSNIDGGNIRGGSHGGVIPDGFVNVRLTDSSSFLPNFGSSRGPY